MPSRSSVLQSFLDRFHEAVLSGAPPDGSAARAANRIFGALAAPAESRPAPPVPSAIGSHLHQALATAGERPGPIAAMTEAFAELEPSLVWRRRARADADPEFAAGHSNANIVGPEGLERRKDVWVGVSLMAPGIRYPDHQHPPEEVYVVLSPGEWRQGDGPWFEPGVGGIIFNPPNIVHAMRSGSAPLLAAWCLWLGG